MPERGTTRCRAELPVTRYPTDYGAALAILARFGFHSFPFWEPVCGHEQCAVRAEGNSGEGIASPCRGCLKGGRLAGVSNRARRRFGPRETRHAGIRRLRGCRRAVCGQDPPALSRLTGQPRPCGAASLRGRRCGVWASYPSEQQPGSQVRRRLGHRRRFAAAVARSLEGAGRAKPIGRLPPSSNGLPAGRRRRALAPATGLAGWCWRGKRRRFLISLTLG
jgi:hypothetical protein